MAKQPENEDEDEFSDFDLSEDEDLLLDEESDLFTDENHEADEGAVEEATSVESDETPPPSSENEETHAHEERQLVAAEEIPLTIVVEVGQIEIPMERLLQLEPGNMLDVDLHPKNGVDLTINGKVIGRGELIRIGEVIGVRVLQLGKSAQ